ncbi:hypothetical protein TB2_045130 [Malus domestica]
MGDTLRTANILAAPPPSPPPPPTRPGTTTPALNFAFTPEVMGDPLRIPAGLSHVLMLFFYFPTPPAGTTTPALNFAFTPEVMGDPLRIPAGTREGCGHYSPPLAVHKYIFFLLGMLGVLLGVKHATGDLPSPFVTDHNTVVVLIVDLFAYVGALATAKILQASNNGNMYELMNNISLLFGTLAVILLALLLDPGFGWFTLACWVVSIAIIVTKSYQNLRRLCTAAVGYVRDKTKELMMRMKGTEEPENQDGMP